MSPQFKAIFMFGLMLVVAIGLREAEAYRKSFCNTFGGCSSRRSMDRTVVPHRGGRTHEVTDDPFWEGNFTSSTVVPTAYPIEPCFLDGDDDDEDRPRKKRIRSRGRLRRVHSEDYY